MREIKFRAWIGFKFEYDIMVGKFGNFYVNPGNGGLDSKDSACLSPFNTKYSDSVLIEQFAGLHDKNGREIYEGDICLFPSMLNRVIVWKDGALGYIDTCDDFHAFGGHQWFDMIVPNLEVIGNIHENPELLEK